MLSEQEQPNKHRACGHMCSMFKNFPKKYDRKSK